MDDQSGLTSPTTAVTATPRIKRNTACVNCRDSKVKCNASPDPGQPCVRCTKLEIPCVVDRAHKRISRRSKLEELQQEVRSIKEAVGKTAAPPLPLYARTLPPLNASHGLLPSTQMPATQTLPPMRPFDAPPLLPPSVTPLLPAAVASSVTTTPTPKTMVSTSSGRTAEPRALKSRAFAGEDVNYYFDMYFEHFHPFFPIVRLRDPDRVYEAAPILFWTIVTIAARRFARDESVLPFLTESLTSEVWGAMGNPPLPLGVINALLLLCAWPFTTIRFLRDPSMIFSSIAMSSCYLIGLHTGKGEHPELANPNFQIRNTDEEATFTWAGYNIISQKVASYTGCPATGQFFNKTIETILDRSSAVPVPLNFIILLECARFSNRMSKTTVASLEENRGISHHIVDMFEEEFDKVQRLLFPGISELDYFTLLATLQDLQSFYFMPVPESSSEIFKRNVLKAYGTAQLVMRQARKLQDETGFLSYAPHYVCRTLLTSACITLNVLLSPYMTDMPVLAKSSLMQDAIAAIRTCSVHEGDLPNRASNMIESYWSVHHLRPPMEISMRDVSQYANRLGTSFAFDYIRRWRKDIEASRSMAASNTVRMQQQQQQQGLPLPTTLDLSALQPDATQMIDWDAFMDDFDWSFTPAYFNPA